MRTTNVLLLALSLGLFATGAFAGGDDDGNGAAPDPAAGQVIDAVGVGPATLVFGPDVVSAADPK